MMGTQLERRRIKKGTFFMKINLIISYDLFFTTCKSSILAHQQEKEQQEKQQNFFLYKNKKSVHQKTCWVMIMTRSQHLLLQKQRMQKKQMLTNNFAMMCTTDWPRLRVADDYLIAFYFHVFAGFYVIIIWIIVLCY